MIMLVVISPCRADDSYKVGYFNNSLKKAYTNDAVAANDVGACYMVGYGVSKNYSKALYWFNIASNLGNANAIKHMGDMYYYCLGVPRDVNTAKMWYTKASNLGNTDAAKALKDIKKELSLNRSPYVTQKLKVASYYEKGKILQEYGLYYQSIQPLFYAAYYDKVPDAMFKLGMSYYIGNGVEESAEEAARWFLAGAEKGHTECFHYAGLSCENGLACKRDRKKALYWYDKARKYSSSPSVSEKFYAELSRGQYHPYGTLTELVEYNLRRNRSNNSSNTRNSGNSNSVLSSNVSNNQSNNSVESEHAETRFVVCTSCSGTGLKYKPHICWDGCYSVYCQSCRRQHCVNEYHEKCISCEGAGQRKQRLYQGKWIYDRRK